MATTNKSDKIFVQIGEEKVEATGEILAQILKDRNEALLLETEYKAKQKAREDAIKKLAEVAGLTKEEINAIL